MAIRVPSRGGDEIVSDSSQRQNSLRKIDAIRRRRKLRILDVSRLFRSLYIRSGSGRTDTGLSGMLKTSTMRRERWLAHLSRQDQPLCRGWHTVLQSLAVSDFGKGDGAPVSRPPLERELCCYLPEPTIRVNVLDELDEDTDQPRVRAKPLPTSLSA